jgi:hypothetical protein
MLRGLIDLHVHTSPDVRPRRLDDLAQARLARELGAAALLLKSHVVPTMDRARLTEQLVPGLRVFGALVLNETVGGLNPAAVEAAAALGARIIWMPTLDAANHRQHAGRRGGIELLAAGRLHPALGDILALVARHDLALATGHLSPREIEALVPAAFAAGVRRVVVTHPEHHVVGLSVAAQARLAAEFPLVFERCYAQPSPHGHYTDNLEANCAALRALGPGDTYLSTDCGQVENLPWDDAWRRTFAHFSAAGLAPEAFVHLTHDMPAWVVGLTDRRPEYRGPPAFAAATTAAPVD